MMILNIKAYLFLLLILTTALACTHKETQKESKKKATRPNIIFILSDDNTSQSISAYDSLFRDFFPTPNIDRIANEGVRFDNVYCGNAICGPSRATILTGKYSHQNGFIKNRKGGHFNTNQWTFPEALKDNGYTTAMIGKWHLGPPPKGMDFFMYHDNPGQQGYYWDPVYNLNGTEVKKKGYATNITANTALAWLDTVKDSSKPFALLLHFKAPHRYWAPDKKYENMYPNTDMPYPETFNDDFTGREKTMGNTWMTMDFFNRRDMKLTPPKGLKGKELQAWKGYGGNPGEAWMPEGCSTIEEARKWKYQRFIKDYLACVKSVDDNVGRVLDFLKANNLEENTIVVYTGDQGFFLGDHGLFDKRLISDVSLKMPFLMRYPAKIKAGTKNQNMISNVDFAPTLIDFAGIQIPDEVQGKSLKKMVEGNKEIAWGDKVYYHYYEWPLWHHVQPHYGMRTPKYKIAHYYYNVDVWEMYDMEKDPDEMNNLIGVSEYATVAEKLKEDLKKLMIEVGDTSSLDQVRKLTEEDFGNINY